MKLHPQFLRSSLDKIYDGQTDDREVMPIIMSLLLCRPCDITISWLENVICKIRKRKVIYLYMCTKMVHCTKIKSVNMKQSKATQLNP